MGWKERFRQGSFRGVPFLIDSADSDFGRRLVAHEFPQQENPFVEDLGRRARKFVVECYVLGDSYLTARDLLLAALEKKGPGPLVHPYFGRIEVNVDSVKVRDSSTETRIARFQITFIEAGTTVLPAVATDTVAVVKSNALSTKAQIKAVFTKVYDFAGLPYAQSQSVLTAAQSASDAIRDAQGAVNKVSDFAKDLQDIGASLSQLVLDAELLADSFMNLIGFGYLDEDQNQDEIPDLRQSFQGLTALYSFAPSLPAPSDSSAAFVQMIQLAAINTTGYITSQIEYDSVDEAFAIRDQVFTALEAVMLGDLDDDIFNALTDLRTSIQEDIDARAATLARVVDYNSAQPLPALVIANQLYGDIDQEADIIARNKVRHPGFVGGVGNPIKVLTADA